MVRASTGADAPGRLYAALFYGSTILTLFDWCDQFYLFCKNSNYVGHQLWEATLHNENKHKVVPLAHIQLSRTTGRVKFLALQPESFNTGMKALAIQQALEVLVKRCT